MSVSPQPVAGRRAWVTGGRRGIGRGIAYALAENGFEVVIGDLTEDDDVNETLRGIRQHGVRAAFVRFDVAEVAQHESVLDRVESLLGPLTCLVNNAGISVAKRGDLLDATPESFDELIRVNLRGPFFLAQQMAKRWLPRVHDGCYRSIINISSISAQTVSVNRAEYCISKAGITMATQLLATRLGEAGVGVFEIRPGVIRTPMTAGVAQAYDQRIAAGLSPMPRWGEPADVGRAAAALAGGAFAFSTGDAIHVDGGLHIARL